jgi:hypothetical protein
MTLNYEMRGVFGRQQWSFIDSFDGFERVHKPGKVLSLEMYWDIAVNIAHSWT